MRLIASDFDEYLTSEELGDIEKENSLYMGTLSNEEFVAKQQEQEDARRASKKNQEQTATYGLKKLLESKIKILLREKVSTILKKLYEQLATEAAKQDEPEPKAWWIRTFAELYPNKCKEIFPNGSLVGPVGERPLHVCGLLAARYRGDAENQGHLIAEGIFEGMKEFLKHDGERWIHEARFSYGRDYCAAVGHYIYKSTNKVESKTNDRYDPWTLPQYKYILGWYEQRSVGKGSQNWQKHQHHIKAIVRKGLYQGETLLFPFIASSYDSAVKWLLEQFSKLENEARAVTNSRESIKLR